LLINSLENGNTELAKLLIVHNVDFNIKNAYGKTPLMIASMKGYIEIVELLLKNKADSSGVDVNAVDSNGKSALAYAQENCKGFIAELLVKHGANG